MAFPFAIMTSQEKTEYFLSFPVAVFYDAFKVAGGKLPVGRPPLDAKPIIERALAITPSVAAGTAAVLNRRYPVGYVAPVAVSASVPSGWEEDEEKAPIAAPSPVVSEPVFDPAILAPYALKAEVSRDIRELRHSVETHTGQLGELKTAVIALQKQTPVQFVIEGKPSAVIEGAHYMFPRLVHWMTLRAEGVKTKHALLVGPASSGKTSAALQFARLKDLPLYSQLQTADSTGIVGYIDIKGERVETEFTKAWLTGGVYLIDEMSTNGADALSVLNGALANGICTIPGIGLVTAHPDFYCIAGDNSDKGATVEYAARQLLDGATLDRFVRLQWEIDPIIEGKIGAPFPHWLAAVRAIRAFIKTQGIAHVGATVRSLIDGIDALHSGMPREWVLEDTCKKGVLFDDWNRVTALPDVSRFLKGY